MQQNYNTKLATIFSNGNANHRITTLSFRSCCQLSMALSVIPRSSHMCIVWPQPGFMSCSNLQLRLAQRASQSHDLPYRPDVRHVTRPRVSNQLTHNKTTI